MPPTAPPPPPRAAPHIIAPCTVFCITYPVSPPRRDPYTIPRVLALQTELGPFKKVFTVHVL